MWDVSSKKKVLDVDVGDWVECLDWSGDGKTLGCGGGFDKQGKLFDAEDGELQETLDHGGIVYACAFAPTQPVFACGCFEKKVTLWHKDRGHLPDAVVRRRAQGVGLAPGREYARVGRLRRRRDGSAGGRFEHEATGGDCGRSKLDSIAADCRDLAYTPDGSISRVVRLGRQGHRLRRGDRERLWEITNPAEQHFFALAFSPEGDVFVAGGWDFRATMYRLER